MLYRQNVVDVSVTLTADNLNGQASKLKILPAFSLWEVQRIELSHSQLRLLTQVERLMLVLYQNV